MEQLSEVLDENTPITAGDIKSKIEESILQIFKSSGEFLTSAISSFSSFFSILLLLPVYIIFMLMLRKRLVLFVKKSFGLPRQNKILSFFEDSRKGMMNYLKGLGLVILIIAVLNSIGLAVIGLEYSILIGTFSALLIIIPYVGVAVGALIPIAVAILTKDNYLYAVSVAILYGIVQFLEGNFITPKLMGDTINLNPLAILVFLVLMSSIGGIIGMIVAVPLLNLIKLALQNSPSLETWAILLENSDENSSV